jgi:hypothetical protein
VQVIQTPVTAYSSAKHLVLAVGMMIRVSSKHFKTFAILQSANVML